MKEIAIRAGSGAVYAALVLGAAWSGHQVTALLFLVIAALAAREWHRLHWRGKEAAPPMIIGIALTAACYAAWAWLFAFPDPHFPVAIAIVIGAMLIAFVAVLRTAPTAIATAIGQLAVSVLLIALPMACAPFMAMEGNILVGFMLLLWANDTGAYLLGRAIGRTKLMPSVSPGKTVEGLLGGLVLTIVAAWVVARWIDHELEPSTWLIAAPFITFSATIGDLLESAMKRAAGVKDSGTIMPGHGGVLDRFDGYLLAAPVMVVIALLLG
ncbi:MAG: phosphatidate cytidylyltransferase [Flavobacteriales bacterium]|nr:phosphatidate cytidylyltransferase [Flavobacteriales bacterium]